MDKKYQVFISSTYEDLKIERQKAINAILRLEQIPIGMELFNAGDADQWAIIQRAINSTDYYVLIIGYRYGSLTKEDISFTEKEYEYAISKNVPVLAFIKKPDMPSTKKERETKLKYQKKLDAFISKVTEKLVNFWETPDELASQITSSLFEQMRLTPRTGWIRADFDPIEMNQEMVALSKENRELRKVVDNINNRQPNLEISVLDPDNSEEEAEMIYQYQQPFGNINVRPLTIEDDLVDEVKELITEKDLQAYNNELPAQEEIDDYNVRNTLYENAQNNAYSFRLGIENSGNGKANNIYVDLSFPESLLAYYDYDIKDIRKPEMISLPTNPITHALGRVRSTIQTKNNLTASFREASFLGSPYKRDYFVDESHSVTTIKIDSILHSRMYTSDEIWFIATQKGKFTVKCEIMCEEYEVPTQYSFTIEFN